jgi:hypothetical protein
LTAADGQGDIFIGARAEFLRHKFVARDRQHRTKDAAIFNAAAPQLFFNHFCALGRVLDALRHA